jgi:GH25 family lysozyme M1 (1,4-beta-N-acetylmuramidase)
VPAGDTAFGDSVTVQIVVPQGPQTMILGLDSSSQINWSNAYQTSYQFGFCKITEGLDWPAQGSTQQKAFDSNVGACIEAGMLIGAYHFGRPVPNPSLTQAQEEGRTFADAFNTLRQQYTEATWLYPVLDIENNDYGEHPGETLGTTALSQWVLAWITEVKQVANVSTVIIYADRDTRTPDMESIIVF